MFIEKQKVKRTEKKGELSKKQKELLLFKNIILNADHQAILIPSSYLHSSEEGWEV